MLGKQMYYPDSGSLRPVRDVLKDAAEVFNEKFRTRWRFSVPPAVGGIGGGAVGVGVGKATLIVGAAAGTKGAAALTSGLAFAGGAVGGAMAAGIAVVAVPVIALGAVGAVVVRHWQKNRLRAEKEEFLTAVLSRYEAIKKKTDECIDGDRRRVDHLYVIGVRLGDAIKHLKHDLK